MKYIFNKVKQELIYVSITTLVVYFLTSRFEHLIPEIPLAIPTFLGTAISVILSFKLSQSYDRWWEARKIWGAIVNDSRNLILQLQAFVNNNSVTINRIAYRQIAWCYALGRYLRGLNPLSNLEPYFTVEDHKVLDQHTNKALAILQLNNQDIAMLRNNGHIDSYNHVQLNNTMVNLVNAMGMAERIKGTIFPVTYRLFLHLIIYVFIITLSIALRKTAGYFEIPLLLLIASFFFLLERTATHLQDPFSNKPTDTPMTAIATNIEIGIKHLIGDSDVPEPHQPDKYFLI
ncbi:bestrophin family ion channel [Paraflavitalea sp. CAU 1676]|uniref:bestrophin family protein n=1 Tax=Paraflavitalea sp. CAU 1676 TaxID=3032598 RepID=UPI0023DC897F|nr:bestrophin family ion channel [Paraflavitalea sp. CAU 1676]MDF2191299.1 bestrophin family ion channel [Paraflavitalea sp. CAU 1676]